MCKDVVLVTGSRFFRDYKLIEETLTNILTCDGGGVLILGDCPTGADKIALDVANNEGCWFVDRHEADWDTFGKAAGPIRNGRMVDEAKRLYEIDPSVLVLAFHIDAAAEFADRGGTADTLRRVRKASLPYQFHVSTKGMM